jgi:hypothetical protein
MKTMIRRLLRSEEGGMGTLMVVGFMALSVPMLTAALGLAATLSHDSQVKNKLAKDQYSSIGAFQYVRYLSDSPERWNEWWEETEDVGTPGEETFNFGDDEINILADSNGVADYGFLGYCIFGSTLVHVKENSAIGSETNPCSIGSNGDIDIKENSVIKGNIVSGGNVTLKENVRVYGNVTAEGAVTLNDRAQVIDGTIQQGVPVDTIAGPTLNYDVTVTTTYGDGGEDVENMLLEGPELPGTFDLTGGGLNVTVNSNQTYTKSL